MCRKKVEWKQKVDWMMSKWKSGGKEKGKKKRKNKEIGFLCQKGE